MSVNNAQPVKIGDTVAARSTTGRRVEIIVEKIWFEEWPMRGTKAIGKILKKDGKPGKKTGTYFEPQHQKKPHYENHYHGI